MDMRIVFAILLAVVIAAAGAGVASYSYSLGVAQGIAQAGKAPAPGPYPGFAYPYPYWYGAPFHGPFGFFGLLWAVLLVFLVVSLVRGMFWRGRGAWGRGAYREGVPPWFEEWHRRAHESRGTGG
jgi:hypothetical protein